MTVYPNAIRRLIPAGENDPEIIPVGVVLHVDAGNAFSLFNWFNGPSGGIESHGHIRKDGVLEQYRIFEREADAQSAGNSWIGEDGRRYGFISLETQGTMLGYWTRAQKQTIKEFLRWSAAKYEFPLAQVHYPQPPSLAVGGVGYHSLFKIWNPLSKSCPGPKRIAWFNQKLVPWMKEQRRLYHTVSEGDSILSVCRMYGVTPAQLWRWNRPLLSPGEKLRVR